MSYIERLKANCDEALQAKPNREFVLGELSELKHIEAAIYVIEEIGGSPQNTFLEMSQFKSERTRSCPRLNSPSQVLYVGSSTTGLRTRIKQHLGKGNSRTYALQLEHWFKGEYRITIKCYDVPIEVLQIIEDAFWADLKPAFGKPGANNTVRATRG